MILDYYRDVNILCKDDTGIIAHFLFFFYIYKYIYIVFS